MDDTVLWTLIAVQVFMGGFDTLVHHEGSERLAWRASQKTELRLHGVRNLFYMVIFLCLGWVEPHGLYTIALATILGVEVLITLWDFVEEDLTRKLPASERINHTLLALNYGAILALAGPVLWEWARLPSGVVLTSYGWWSAMATASAVGVGAFGLRDLLAAARSDRLVRGDPARLAAGLAPHRHVLVTGGTGFIGERLVEALVSAGHIVTVLTRDPDKADHLVHPVRRIPSLDQVHDSDRLDAVVNLAGEPIANGFWTRKKRARIIGSRVETTRAVLALIARLERKPECLISGSAIGWYGLCGDEVLTEEAGASPAFVHDVCAEWEGAAARVQGVRLVILRIGLVLGVEGGMLARLLTPFEFGAGGRMGSGRQWMSWIERDDLVRAICFVMGRQVVRGVVNATGPEPVRNAAFANALAGALHRPAVIPLPGWLIARGLGDLGRETMLGGQRVVPERLLQAGFRFAYPTLAPMLKDITGASDRVPDRAGIRTPVSETT